MIGLLEIHSLVKMSGYFEKFVGFTKENIHNILHVVMGGTLAIIGFKKLLTYLPSPEKFMDYAFGYRKTMLIKSAVELQVFIKIKKLVDEKLPVTVINVAKACGTSEKGMRILLDALHVHGFLKKYPSTETTYSLTLSSQIFLSDVNHEAYFGNVTEFLCSSK